MVLLLLVCSVLIKVTTAEYGISGLPYQDHQGYASAYHDYKPHDYQFSYGVSDPHTGDHKAQWEVKEKGVVRGGYSLLEPDGTTRIVEYIADDDGFRAVVKKLGTSIHPTHGHVEAHGFSHINQHQQQAAPKGLYYESYPQGHSEKIIVENPEYHDDDDEHLIEKPQFEYEHANLEHEEENEEEEHNGKHNIQPSFKSYSGDIDNYSNVLSAAVAHLKPEEYPKPIEIPHTVELHGYQNLAHANEITPQYYHHYQHPQLQTQADFPRAPGLHQGGNPSHDYYYQNSVAGNANYDPFTQAEKNFIEPTASIEYPIPEAQNHYPSYSYFGQANGPRYARSFTRLRKMEMSGNQAKPMVMSYAVSHH